MQVTSSLRRSIEAHGLDLQTMAAGIGRKKPFTTSEADGREAAKRRRSEINHKSLDRDVRS